ncbi:MAG: CZB domain-containing protein [Bacteroidia bacterium]|nr:CZB domain-containing protein [Bacteroidia bacterium]
MQLDFLLAKNKHVRWRVRLLSFLEGQESLTYQEVVSHRDCELGKWIYSIGLKKYAHLESFQKLEQVHEIFHRVVKAVVELKEKNDIEGAKREYEQMKEISERILQLLDQCEAEIAKIPQEEM